MIGILGTGLVARKIAEYLTDEEFLFFGSSEREVKIGDKVYKSISYDKLNEYSFDVVFGATDEKRIKESYENIKANLLIDNSEAFRQSKLVPLIAAGVNDSLFNSEVSIVSNPNCVSIMILNLLYPLHKSMPISKTIMTSLQSVSGMGDKALAKLDKERSDYEYLNKHIMPQFELGGRLIRMYDNIVPYVGQTEENLKTHEENKIVMELKKVIDENFELDATCIRVPITYGHTAILHITLKEEVNLQRIRRLIDLDTNIVYKDLLTIEDAISDSEHVYATKLRKDPFCPYGFTITLMSNNLTVGAALNSYRLYKLYKEKKNVL